MKRKIAKRMNPVQLWQMALDDSRAFSWKPLDRFVKNLTESAVRRGVHIDDVHAYSAILRDFLEGNCGYHIAMSCVMANPKQPANIEKSKRLKKRHSIRKRKAKR